MARKKRQAADTPESRPKKTGCVRVTPLEIVRVEGLSRDDERAVRDEWMELARAAATVANTFAMEWVVWHHTHGSRAAIREWLGRDKADRGPFPVECCPAALMALATAECRRAAPQLHGRCVTLILNRLRGDLVKRKASRGSLKGWIAVLLGHQRMPAWELDVPIPFDAANSELLAPLEPEGDFRCGLRIDYFLDAKGKGTSHRRVVVLRTTGGAWKARRKVVKVATGEWTLRGSTLAFDERRKKWVLNLCYAIPTPDRTPLDPDRVATLAPGARVLWSLRLPGAKRVVPYATREEQIAELRKTLAATRHSIHAMYRTPGSGRKGHGRRRALAPTWRLRKLWDNYAHTLNQQVAAGVVRDCLQAGCGTLVYWQPEGEAARDRLLATAGKSDDGPRESTSWPWHRMQTCLASKCQYHGLEFVVRKFDRADLPTEFAAGTDAKTLGP